MGKARDEHYDRLLRCSQIASNYNRLGCRHMAADFGEAAQKYASTGFFSRAAFRFWYPDSRLEIHLKESEDLLEKRAKGLSSN